MPAEKVRLMVVDDLPKLARVIRLVLEEVGLYEVLIETRPDQVVAAARSYRPAAILLDVDMPGKNGAEVARDLWRETDLRHIPILFFTGLLPIGEGGLRETAHGTRRFISKMIKTPQLLAAIEDVLSAKADVSSAPANCAGRDEENMLCVALG